MPPRLVDNPAFARAAAMDARVPAPRSVVVPPSGFGATYKMRPHQPVSVGLRPLSEDDTLHAATLARSEADRVPVTNEDAWIELYNDAVMRHILAVACCKADDVSRPFFESVANDAIRIALIPTTIRRLYQEYEILSVASSPISIEVSEAETVVLADRLLAEYGTMSATAKRLAAALLAELGPEMPKAG